MTRRILSIGFGDTLFVSQKFNGDRTESQMFNLSPIALCWDDVVEMFKGVKSVRAFEKAVAKVEKLYHYRNIPIKSLTSLPNAEEVWQMMDGELELFAQYGDPIVCGA